MQLARWRLAAGLFCLLAAFGLAQDSSNVSVPGESKSAASRLDEARKRIFEKRLSEGLGMLQSLIESSNNELVPLPGGRSVAARWLCHVQISRSGKLGLLSYRKRVEAQAQKLLEQANRGSVTALHRLVEEFFCTRHGLEALDRLGDFAFERGEFAEAEAWWSRIVPLEPLTFETAARDTLVFPDPFHDRVARVRAKQLLARLFAGRPGWRLDLDAYRRRHGKAAGKLAGRAGLYADILAGIAEERRKDAAPEEDWPTFGGSPERGRAAAVPARFLDQIGRLCRAGATWQFDLEKRRKRIGEPPVPTREEMAEAARRLAFYPVVVGQTVLVADSTRVTGYDLRTGKVSEWFDAEKLLGADPPENDLPAPADLRYSLTAADGHVFARLGSVSVRDNRPPPKDGARPVRRKHSPAESILVCLAAEPDANGNRARWSVRASDPGRKEYAVFEGAPLVHQGRVYVAATRFEGDQVVTAIHCYPAHPEDTTAPLLWKTDVARTQELLPASAALADGALARKTRERHHLLTLAGAKIVYCSHSGVIAALEARTGKRAWAIRYPRRDMREPADNPGLRDLAPPLFADGRVYVAPADSDRTYCLDPATGSPVWVRSRLDVVHLLGVGSGRLIFTTWRAPRQGQLNAGGLRAVDAATGSDAGGWLLPDEGGGLVPFGRGQLVGDLVLWPTSRKPYGVFAVRQTDGQQPDNPTLLHRIPSGNLLYVGGCLLVTDRHTLHAFVPPELLAEDAGDGTARRPRGMLRQASAFAARGDVDRGRELLAAARERLGADPGHSARALLREAWRLERAFLLDHAWRAAAAGEAAEVEGRLDQLPGEVDSQNRLITLVESAQRWAQAGQKQRAREAWQAVLARPEWRCQPLRDAAGLPARAGLAAAEQVRRLGEDRGDGVRRLWEASPVSVRPGLLGQLFEHQRGRPATRALLEEQAALAEKGGRAAEAALQRARLVTLGLPPDEEAETLLALSRLWEKLGCPHAARAVRHRLGRDEGEQATRPEGEATLDSPDGWPALPVCTITLEPGECHLPSPGAEGPAGEAVFSARGEDLMARSRWNGEVLWSVRLPFAPVWVRGLGGVLVAAGAGGMAALDAVGGWNLWAMQAPRQDRYPRTRDLPVQPPGEEPGAALSDFHLAGTRLVCTQGRRTLLCLDALAGRVLWQREAPGARFGLPWPRGVFHTICPAGEERLLVQAASRAWFLETRSGEEVAAFPAPERRWPRPPLVLGNRVCLVEDAGQVSLFDAETGRRLWAAEMPARSLRSGEPPVVFAGGGELCIVKPLNVGYRLDRLDLTTGRSLLDADVPADLASLSPGSWLAAGNRIYHTDGTTLAARDLFHGRVVWSRPLPASGRYRLEHRGGTLLVIPDRAAAARFSFRWLGSSLQWRVGPLPGGLAWSVTCYDAATGDPVQRINLDVTRLGVKPVTAPGRGCGLVPLGWVGKEPGGVKGPRVTSDARGLIVGLGDQVRVLNAETPPSSK